MRRRVCLHDFRGKTPWKTWRKVVDGIGSGSCLTAGFSVTMSCFHVAIRELVNLRSYRNRLQRWEVDETGL
jgi:hypothetical protein